MVLFHDSVIELNKLLTLSSMKLNNKDHDEGFMNQHFTDKLIFNLNIQTSISDETLKMVLI